MSKGKWIEWSDDMIETLKRDYPTTPNKDLVEKLGVSEKCVVRKARQLGLSKDHDWLTEARKRKWTPEEKKRHSAYLREWYNNNPEKAKAVYKKGLATKFLKKYMKKNTKRIYISGPISGHDINERKAEFQRVEYHLICQGFEPVNPMNNGLPPEATTHEHMKRDIELLMTCDYIYLMRRWTHSKGCKVEFDVATAIGLKVMFEEASELIEFE